MYYINQQYTADCLSTCPLYINFISQLMQCSGLEVAGSSRVQDFEFDKHTPPGKRFLTDQTIQITTVN